MSTLIRTDASRHLVVEDYYRVVREVEGSASAWATFTERWPNNSTTPTRVRIDTVRSISNMGARDEI